MLKQLSGAWCLEPLIAPGSAGLQVLGTRLCYQHDVRPKGLPPGVQFVPGMSGAVKMSVAKEVRQMVDKVDYVAEKVRAKGDGGGSKGDGIQTASGLHAILCMACKCSASALLRPSSRLQHSRMCSAPKTYCNTKPASKPSACFCKRPLPFGGGAVTPAGQPGPVGGDGTGGGSAGAEGSWGVLQKAEVPGGSQADGAAPAQQAAAQEHAANPGL